MISIQNSSINEVFDSFQVLHNCAAFFVVVVYFNYFYVRHGLNKQISAYKFLTGFVRVLTSIKLYHISTKLDSLPSAVPSTPWKQSSQTGNRNLSSLTH